MHPILIQVTDDFFIATYGLMVVMGLLAAGFFASWRGQRQGLSPDVFYDLLVIAIVSGFLGARVLFIITVFPDFLRDPAPYIFSRTGFVFLGGLIAATAGCAWYIQRKKLDFWVCADILAPAVAIGHAFGRIGCHFSGCCYGGVCNLPVGIQVPRVIQEDGTPWLNAWYDQWQANMIEATAEQSLPIWPVQLMEAGALFLLAALLIPIGLRRIHRGTVFGLYLAAYAVLRFGLEFLRGDIERGVFFGGLLSTSQLISGGLLVVGIAVLATRTRRAPYEPGPVAAK